MYFGSLLGWVYFAVVVGWVVFGKSGEGSAVTGKGIGCRRLMKVAAVQGVRGVFGGASEEGREGDVVGAKEVAFGRRKGDA
jgi:hypothetical protein